MCGWQRVSEQLAENLGPNSSLLITSPHRLSKSTIGVVEIDGRLSACMVGYPYLGITSCLPVIHPEHVPEAIRIPSDPDASASALTARAPAQVAVRTVIVRLMSDGMRKPIF